MSHASGLDGGSLSAWLEAEGITSIDTGPGRIADVALVRSLLLAAARERRAVSYSELLGALGHRFTRPKMRALCRTLDAVDEAGSAAGAPGLAVLVVRESDRLPGQGWWTSAARAHGYTGPWSGAPAAGFVRERQERAFNWIETAGQ